ncbi:hypothetical protein ANN_19444 [Periplaneta americana]|uniref:Uncharacterized protein n=1 Tax=Periplaneta americana TaxID=6978 RepID=A0ABQ8SAA1_PERAM|nr:hypothetical protein ANN_19444 [Periplaneta americana]
MFQDEEWNEQPSEDSLFLVQPTAGGRSCSSSSWRGPGADLSLPRARRVHSSGIESPSSPSSPVANISGTPPDLQAFRRRRPAEERQRSPSPSSSAHNHAIKKGSSGPLSPRDRFKDAKEKFLLLERERLEEQERLMQRRRNLQSSEPPIAPAVMPTAGNSRGSHYQRRGSWSRSRDSEDELEDRPQRGYFGVHSPPVRDDFDNPEPDAPGDNEDDIFEHGYSSSPIRHVTRRDSYNNRQVSRENPHHHHDDQDDLVPLRRGHRPQKTDAQVYRGGRNRGSDDPRIIPHQRYRSPSREDLRPSRGPRNPPDEDIVPERRQMGHRYRSPTRVARRDQDFSPDRRERFLSPTRNPRPRPRNQRKIEEDIGYPCEEVPRYRGGPRDRTPNPSRGHLVLSQQPSYSEDSSSDIPLERYRSPIRNPQPTPRHRIPEGEEIGSPEPQRRNVENRLPRAIPFQIPGGGDKKRRSMFEMLEEERRRNSNELAKEFKRRSYQDGGGSELSSGDRGGGHANGIPNGRHSGYQELSEHERFPGLDRDTARLQHHNIPPPNGGHHNLKKSAGPPPPDVVAAAASRYRHSYAEPHHMLPHPPPPHHHEMLHRTNSSVSSGRVGIAAVHPY